MHETWCRTNTNRNRKKSSSFLNTNSEKSYRRCHSLRAGVQYLTYMMVAAAVTATVKTLKSLAPNLSRLPVEMDDDQSFRTSCHETRNLETILDVKRPAKDLC